MIILSCTVASIPEYHFPSSRPPLLSPPRPLLFSAKRFRKDKNFTRSVLSFIFKITVLRTPETETFKGRKLAWFGHVTHNSLSKAILQGTLDDGRHRGRQRKCWMDSIKEWTSLSVPELLTMASCRKRLEEELSSIVPRVPPPPHNPIGQGTELN